MKIIWSENALHDLKEIKAYISKDSIYSALYVIESILDKTALLTDMPHAGHHVPESLNENLREIHSTPYRVIYSASVHEIHIVTIVHMARRISM